MEKGSSFEIWGRMGGWISKLGRGVYGCDLWRSIWKGWEAFSKNIQFKVGLGNTVKFWTDRWCGELPLHLAFPVLYNFATNKAASVESSLLWQGTGGRRDWDVRFIRGPNDWEVDVVDDFFWFLASKLPLADDSDRMRWKLTKNGDFNIRSSYHKLHASSSVVFPWKGIWKVKAPCCVSFFVWTVAWDRILTGDNLGVGVLIFVDWHYVSLLWEDSRLFVAILWKGLLVMELCP